MRDFQDHFFVSPCGERGKGKGGKGAPTCVAVPCLCLLSWPQHCDAAWVSPCPCCRAIFLPQPEQLVAHSDANGYCKVGRP